MLESVRPAYVIYSLSSLTSLTVGLKIVGYLSSFSYEVPTLYGRMIVALFITTLFESTSGALVLMRLLTILLISLALTTGL